MASTATESFTSVQEIMLEFRAGRMFMEGTRVLPDSRKGLVRIGRGEEGLIHFQWLEQNQNIVEEDQIVFPEEAVFEKVSQSSDRVYVLKFKSDSRRFFFWMQEPKSDGDPQICNLVNVHMNQPFADAVEEEDEASIPLQTSEMSEDTAEEETSSRAGNVIEPSLTSSSFGDITSPSGPVQLADLQRILSSIGSSDETLNHDEGLGLGDILKPDLLLPLMDDLCIEKKLASYLPEGSWTRYEVMELLQSPQLRQQLEAFTSVLRSGQIDLSQFGINPSKHKFTVLSFLEALEDSVSSSSEAETDVRRGDGKDLDSHMCNAKDPMDEGQ